MSLQESLTKFKQQQQKCQSTLTSISRAGASKPSQKTTPVCTSSQVSARALVTPVKFSNDTERLQHINSIRKAPVGAQIKRVLDLLLEI